MQGTFDGWAIDILQDAEPDNIKIFHHAYPPGTWRKDHYGRIVPIAADENLNQSIVLDLSPYGTYDLDLCALCIALGCPERDTFNSCGPVYKEDLENLWRERFSDQPFPKAEPL